LIDASGRRAIVGRRLGAERRRDDALVALVAYGLRNSGYRMERNLVEATPYGWWYAALQPDRRPVFMLHTRPENAGRDGFGSLAAWRAALAATRLIATSFPEPVIDGPLRGHEASGAWLDPAVGDGWLACGDAALSFDPCAAQGLLSALQGGLAAATAVDAALAGDRSLLAAYAAQLSDIRTAYRTQLDAYYAAERRWPDAPFWRAMRDRP
jgi:flavin-dependent dehydrogenase